MNIRNRPIGIWLICFSLIFGIAEQIYYWASGESFAIFGVVTVCLSIYFSIGLFLFNKWAYLIFLFICVAGAFFGIVSSALILGTNSVGLSIDWYSLYISHWQDLVAISIAFACAVYLTRRGVKKLFVANKLNQPGTPQSGAPV